MNDNKFWTNHRRATEQVIAGALSTKEFAKRYGYLPKCVYGRTFHRRSS